MKKLLLGLLAVVFLSVAALPEEPEDVTYDWTPPFEDVSWGWGEDEAMEGLDLDVEDAALGLSLPKHIRYLFYRVPWRRKWGWLLRTWSLSRALLWIGVTFALFRQRRKLREIFL